MSLKLKGVYCYEAMKEGDLKLFVVPTDVKHDSVEVLIERHDLQRLLYAVSDAMLKKESRR